MFTAMMPGYNLYSGAYVKIGFMYILAFYGILFFTQHLSLKEMSEGTKIRT